MHQRINELIEYLKPKRGAAIAFSGGVDSTFLLAVAKMAFGDRLLAVIGQSPTYPARELESAIELAKSLGVQYKVVETCELEDPEFNQNPPHRCFVCKSSLLSLILETAREFSLPEVLEGSNADDAGDFRPGLEAVRKLGIGSPLRELGFSKKEIRELSSALALPTWNKPAFACLASRIPYGETIDRERLARIEKAENLLLDLGLKQFRVRDHGDIARIEVLPDDIATLAAEPMRQQLVTGIKAAGYRYVSLDLQGYRTGAMNETLSTEQRNRATGKVP